MAVFEFSEACGALEWSHRDVLATTCSLRHMGLPYRAFHVRAHDRVAAHPEAVQTSSIVSEIYARSAGVRDFDPLRCFRNRKSPALQRSRQLRLVLQAQHQ